MSRADGARRRLWRRVTDVLGITPVPAPTDWPELFRYRDDEEIERPFNMGQLRRLLSYVGPYRGLTAAATVLTVTGALMQLARPIILSDAVDQAIASRPPDPARLDVFALAYLASYLVTYVTSTLQMRLTARLGQNVLADLRRHLYSHIQGLSLVFFDGRPVGNILVRVTNDVNSLGDLFTTGIVTLLTNVFLLGGIVVVMMALNWSLALACFAIVPVMVVLSTRLRRRIRRGWQMVRRRLSRINAHLNESIQGIRVTQAFVREESNGRFFTGLNHDYYRTWMQTNRVSSLFSPLVNLTGAIGTAIVFFYGAELVRSGALQIGVLIAFIQYVALFWQPISMLGNLYNSLLQAMASSERIFQFLDFKPVVTSRPEAEELPPVVGEVQFDHVTFAYPGGRAALSDVSFVVRPGQTVALVGQTGAGKTTVTSLLCRFYDPTSGSVRVDGHDLRDVSVPSLRRQIGMVLQDTFVFSGTLATNLRYGRLDAALSAVEEAGRSAGLAGYVQTLPDAYDTEVHERGSRLSAGQRQLLAIGRALLADPRILILDEATSSIDTHTELLVQRALSRLLEGRTAFVVAHRLSTIRQADLILVLDHGRIVESGTHTELLARNGAYADLLRAQFRFLEAAGKLDAAGA